jgi:cytochrome P450
VEINVTGGSRYFFTREPEHVKTVLTSKFTDYGKGPEFHRVWVSFCTSWHAHIAVKFLKYRQAPFLGDSIFTTDHQQWHESRNLIRPMFIKNRVSDLEIFERWTGAMINLLPTSGQTVDMQDFFYRLTIDVTTEFLLGESVNSLGNPRSEFVQAFADVQRMQIMLTALL